MPLWLLLSKLISQVCNGCNPLKGPAVTVGLSVTISTPPWNNILFPLPKALYLKHHSHDQHYHKAASYICILKELCPSNELWRECTLCQWKLCHWDENLVLLLCSPPQFKSQLLSLWSCFPLIHILGGRKWRLKHLGPCHPHGGSEDPASRFWPGLTLN